MGQKRVISQLRRATRSKRVSHAYLFTGGSTTQGKMEIAKVFAAAFLCTSEGEDAPCGVCRHCVKVQHAVHPDLFDVEPTSTSIKIAQMRDLIGRAYLSPVEAERKVYILSNVEMLTLDAANSLLRLLEEPPGHGVFILLADSSEVISTIVSRCQVLRFDTEAAKETESDKESAVLAADWLLLSAEQRMQKAVILSKGKHDLAGFIETLTWWVRDAYLYQSGLASFIDVAKHEKVHAISLRYRHEDLRDKWLLLLKSKRLIDRNVNRRALTDYVLWVLLDEVN